MTVSPLIEAETIDVRAQVLHEEGLYRAAARLAQYGLQLIDPQLQAGLAARLCHTVGRALMWADDLAGADQMYAQALQYAQQSGNRGQLLITLLDRAQIPARNNDLAGTLPLLEAAAAEALQHGEVQTQITVLVNIGAVRAVLGREPETAVAMLEQALILTRQNGNRRDLVSVLHSYAYGLIHMQRLPAAAALLIEGLELAVEIEHDAFILEMVEGFGLLACFRNERSRAAQLLGTVTMHERTVTYVRKRADQALQQYQLTPDISLAGRAAVELGRHLLADLRRPVSADAGPAVDRGG